MMTKSIQDLRSFKEKIPKTYLVFDSNKEKAKRQDAIDSAYREAYPFISEARGKTDPFTRLSSPFTLPVLAQLVPEGANDKTRVTIGLEGGKERAVWLWRDENTIKVATWEGAVTSTEFGKKQEEAFVEITFPAKGRKQYDCQRN